MQQRHEGELLSGIGSDSCGCQLRGSHVFSMYSSMHILQIPLILRIPLLQNTTPLIDLLALLRFHWQDRISVSRRVDRQCRRRRSSTASPSFAAWINICSRCPVFVGCLSHRGQKYRYELNSKLIIVYSQVHFRGTCAASTPSLYPERTPAWSRERTGPTIDRTPIRHW